MNQFDDGMTFGGFLKGISIVIVAMTLLGLLCRYIEVNRVPVVIEVTDSTEKLTVRVRYVFKSDEVFSLEARTNSDYPQDGKVWMLKTGNEWIAYSWLTDY